MKKLNWLTILLILFSSCATEKTPPNIIFIMSDDHAYQAISAYKHKLNTTPNIDRIAKEGAIFNKGFVISHTPLSLQIRAFIRGEKCCKFQWINTFRREN